MVFFFSCSLQKICNGHGGCECGKCVCHEGYTGVTCGAEAVNEAFENEMSESAGEAGENEGMVKESKKVENREDEQFNEMTGNRANKLNEYDEVTAETQGMTGQESKISKFCISFSYYLRYSF